MKRSLQLAAPAILLACATATPNALADTTTFTIDDNFTGGTPATIGVTLTDDPTAGAGGAVKIDLQIIEPLGDIRGIFFHVADESLLTSLSVTGPDVTGFDTDPNTVINLGKGANLNGGESPQGPFDAGVAFGSPGIGKDDINSTTFWLTHDTDPIDISLIQDQWFGVRVTSVGDRSSRSGSTKLQGLVPEPTSAALLTTTAATLLTTRRRKT